MISANSLGQDSADGNGITLSDGSGNIVQGNLIGTDIAGADGAIGNRQNGVLITSGSDGNLIGGMEPGAGNVISGNGQNGVAINGSGADTNVIQNNYIGTDVTGMVAVANGMNDEFGDGIEINGGSGNDIVSNLISGNTKEGVYVYAGATDNTIRGNSIGTNAAGTAAIPNQDDGVDIRETTGNTVGGPEESDANVISGNVHEGIEIAGWVRAIAVGDGATVTPGSSGFGGTLVQGNVIGSNLEGDVVLANLGSGIEIEYSDNNLLSNNFITSNGENGVLIHSGSTLNTVSLSFVSGNSQDGVLIDVNSTDNLINDFNIIVSNGDDGIELRGNANVVQGNQIGNASAGNLEHGVEINGGANNLIGGTDFLADNLIGNNGGYGVALFGRAATDNRIEANFIGTDSTAMVDLGNVGGGVLAQGSGSNTIGGAALGAGNTIAFNDGNGVTVIADPSPSIQKGILANSIFDNDGLGIDLGDDGVTANDVGDGDVGANHLQNYPVITSVTSGTETTILGTFNSLADTNFRIDFFSSPTADPSGFGEGKRFLGTANLLTDASGDAVINETLTGVSVTTGSVVTATATNLTTGDTSEFSAGLQLPGEFDFGDAPDPVDGTSGEYPTLLVNDGARHAIVEGGPHLGNNGPDSEADGQPHLQALGDDNNLTNDEDALEQSNFVLIPGESFRLFLRQGDVAGVLNAWIDYNRDGDWNDNGEQIAANLAVGGDGFVQTIDITVPRDAVQGVSFGRFRMSTQAELLPTGEAPDGEVEDHMFLISGLDFGDAPDSYGTTFDSDGARHATVRERRDQFRDLCARFDRRCGIRWHTRLAGKQR